MLRPFTLFSLCLPLIDNRGIVTVHFCLLYRRPGWHLQTACIGLQGRIQKNGLLRRNRNIGI